MAVVNKPSTSAKIAVIGGGVAGSTIALRFAELGLDVSLFEKGPSLVNGPPICHLHAGGNLYREISDEQCLTLLEQSIATVRVYPESVSWRPTVIALPKEDKGRPEDLLPRLHKLRERYKALVAQDPANQVLGEPDAYFRGFDRESLEQLAARVLPESARTPEDWLVPVAKALNLDALQYPVYLVQEYGLNVFRFAAIVALAVAQLPNCRVYTGHQVTGISQLPDAQPWRISCRDSSGADKAFAFDYIVNACGFKSGEIDDLLGIPRQRMVEFKAAYVARWPQRAGQWPELIIHGAHQTLYCAYGAFCPSLCRSRGGG